MSSPASTRVVTESDSRSVVRTNGAYLAALAAHLRHHPDRELLAAHLPAVRLCAERLIQLRVQEQVQGTGQQLDKSMYAEALQSAVALAHAASDQVDAVRWESEAAYLASQLPTIGTVVPDGVSAAEGWLASVRTASSAIWNGCGVGYRDGELWVEPAWPNGGTWWALLGLPLAGGKYLSLLWDGVTLHATQPVRSHLGVSLCKRIQIHGTDEFDFDPYFELTIDSNEGDTATTHRFRPKFLAS